MMYNLSCILPKLSLKSKHVYPMVEIQCYQISVAEFEQIPIVLIHYLVESVLKLQAIAAL